MEATAAKLLVYKDSYHRHIKGDINLFCQDLWTREAYMTSSLSLDGRETERFENFIRISPDEYVFDIELNEGGINITTNRNNERLLDISSGVQLYMSTGLYLRIY